MPLMNKLIQYLLNACLIKPPTNTTHYIQYKHFKRDFKREKYIFCFGGMILFKSYLLHSNVWILYYGVDHFISCLFFGLAMGLRWDQVFKELFGFVQNEKTWLVIPLQLTEVKRCQDSCRGKEDSPTLGLIPYRTSWLISCSVLK